MVDLTLTRRAFVQALIASAVVAGVPLPGLRRKDESSRISPYFYEQDMWFMVSTEGKFEFSHLNDPSSWNPREDVRMAS